MLRLAAPVLAALSMAKTLSFYTDKLGLQVSYENDENYSIVYRSKIETHVWKCTDKIHPKNTSC